MSRKIVVQSGVGLLLALVIALLANFMASYLPLRVDITQDRVYTLTKGTLNILEHAPEDVQIDLYFSRSSGEWPPQIKNYARHVEDILKEYASKSHGKLHLLIHDTKPDTDDDEAARKAGISPIRLPSGNEVFLGALLTAGTKEAVVPYFDPRREEFLEYDLSEALSRLGRKVDPKIGLLSSFPIAGGSFSPNNPQAEAPSEPWFIAAELKKRFEVVSVAADAKEIPAGLAELVVIHPKTLPDATLYAIDQFVMSGGKLLVFVDPFSRYEFTKNINLYRMGGQAPQPASQLDKLLNAYGLEVSKGIVGDNKFLMRIGAGGVTLAYPFFINLIDDRLNRGSSVTSLLSSVVVGEGGAIRLKDGATAHLDPLLSTSTSSGETGVELLSFAGPEVVAQQFKDDGKERILAGLLRGKFSSAFPAGLAGAAGSNTLKETSGESTLLVVADTDMLTDDNMVQKLRLGSQVIARPINDNLSFFNNAVEFMAGSEDLISIRSHGKISRPFTRVLDLQKDAQKRWQDQEAALNGQLSELQKRLNDLQAQRTDGSRFNLSAEQEAEIKNFRGQEVELRRKLREVKKNLREDIERLNHYLVAINLLVLPLTVVFFGARSVWARQKKMKLKRAQGVSSHA